MGTTVDDSIVPRLLKALALVALVLAHHVWGPIWATPARARPHDPVGLRIASWNLRNFPSPEQDLERLGTMLQDLRADILVLQEIHDPAALRALLPGREIVTSEGGGSHGQHLAIAWDPDRVTLASAPVENAAITLGGRVRPSLRVALHTERGPLHVVGVHLKAGADGAPLRRLQWISLLADLAGIAPSEPVVVLGDWNTAGGRVTGPAEELTALQTVLAGAGLVRVPGVGQCTAYWEGVRRDGWWEPSALDHVFVSRGTKIAGLAWAGGACARHSCDPVHSTRGHPDPDLGLGTDHCPVVIDLL